MFKRLKRSLLLVVTASLILVAVASHAHFLLNLNVRVFHVEHASEGLRIYLRTPMPYLVADKIGKMDDGGLPEAAPFTTNAFEDGQIVHFINTKQIADDPLGLGDIAEANTIIEVAGTRIRGDVEAVTVHKLGQEPGFATLSEARQSRSNGTTVPDNPPVYVGDVLVDVVLLYKLDHQAQAYSISSSLDPGLPEQELTANLILDYRSKDTNVIRTRGLMNDPVEVSRSSFAGMATFVWEGIRHILEGIDHVLVVVCLVIGASGLSALLWRVTGFTVGHSVTLSLGFFGFVPSGAWFVPLVETGIALSIVYAAILAVRRDEGGGSSNKKVFVVTVLMGLLHGLGFSFVLHEILQVTSPNIWQSLLAFNVGVEFGQLAIVLLTWPLLRFLARLGPRPELASRLSIAIGCGVIASWWSFERGKDLLAILAS